MQFSFIYRIWYTEDEIYQNKTFIPCVEITDYEYQKILQGVASGLEIKDIPGIESALQKMRDRVLMIDQSLNKDGSERKTPLKKPRNFHRIEYFLTDTDLRLLHRSKDLSAELHRPADSMSFYRHNGSPVKITYQYGRVTVTESDRTIILDADDFISRITQ